MDRLLSTGWPLTTHHHPLWSVCFLFTCLSIHRSFLPAFPVLSCTILYFVVTPCHDMKCSVNFFISSHFGKDHVMSSHVIQRPSPSFCVSSSCMFDSCHDMWLSFVPLHVISVMSCPIKYFHSQWLQCHWVSFEVHKNESKLVSYHVKSNVAWHVNVIPGMQSQVTRCPVKKCHVNLYLLLPFLVGCHLVSCYVTSYLVVSFAFLFACAVLSCHVLAMTCHFISWHVLHLPFSLRPFVVWRVVPHPQSSCVVKSSDLRLDVGKIKMDLHVKSTPLPCFLLLPPTWHVTSRHVPWSNVMRTTTKCCKIVATWHAKKQFNQGNSATVKSTRNKQVSPTEKNWRTKENKQEQKCEQVDMTQLFKNTEMSQVNVFMFQPMTMTVTHSEKPHIRRMKAWPYRQECRGHDPTKRICCAHEACSLARCACTDCKGQCAMHHVSRWTQSARKMTWDNTQAVAVLNSQILYHRILGFGATTTKKQKARKGTDRPGKPRKAPTPGEELGRIPQRNGRTWFTSKFSFFGTRNSYTITSSLLRTRRIVLDPNASTITKLLTTVLLLLLSYVSRSCLQCGAR